MDGCTKARVESTASSTELRANRRHVFASVHEWRVVRWVWDFGIVFPPPPDLLRNRGQSLSRRRSTNARHADELFFATFIGSAYETSATRGGEGAGRRVAVVLCPFAPEARFRTQCYCLVRLKQLCSEHWNLLSDP